MQEGTDMTHGHDPAYCELIVCQLCDAYHGGYSAGKVKALREFMAWDGSHDSLCECAPCQVAGLSGLPGTAKAPIVTGFHVKRGESYGAGMESVIPP